MNKKSWHIILILALLGLVACLGFIAWHLYQDQRSRETYEETASQVTIVTATPTPTLDDDSSLTVEKIEAQKFTGVREGKETKLPSDIFSGRGNPIDFNKLHEINPDLYAWIRIEDDEIDYPIAQHPTDPEYYLNHDLYGDVAVVGCVFTQHYNRKDFSDRNTVIYGHNMNDGHSMFASLHWFEDADFFNKTRYCYIYTPDKIRVYDIFAARPYTNDNLLAVIDWKDPYAYRNFLDEIFATHSMECNIREGVIVTTADRIITLSTCINGQPENRYLVHAKLVWEGTEEQLEQAQAEITARDAANASSPESPSDAEIPEATE